MQHTLRRWAARCALALTAALPLACAAQGKGTITVAQVGPVQGPLGFYIQSTQQGMAAYFGWINSQGGVRGQRLELLLADTPLDAQQTIAQYTRIARQHRPVAFVYPLSPTVIDALLDANVGARLGIPIVGTVPQMYRRRQPVDSHLFFVGVSDAREVRKIAEHIATVGIRKIALVHWDDATTTGLVALLREAARGLGVEIVDAFAVPPDGRADLGGAIGALARSSATAVISLLAAHETARLVSGLRAADSRMVVYGPSYNDPALIAQLAGKDAVHGIRVSQIVPDLDDAKLPLALDFRRHFAERFPGERGNSHAFQGYIAARIIVQALQRCADPQSAACLRDELENTRNHDLGGLRVNYARDNHDGLSYLDIGMVSRSGRLLR